MGFLFVQLLLQILDIDLNISWPSIEVKQITSPPKGRARKNIHNISKSGSESDSPDHKRSRINEENLQKVQDFVKKLESKKTKFTQSKLNFSKK